MIRTNLGNTLKAGGNGGIEYVLTPANSQVLAFGGRIGPYDMTCLEVFYV